MIKKHIPNFITCCNLVCGCIAVVMAFHGNLAWSVYLIWLAMIFDFFDGLAARLLKVSSPMGKELDSLADMVSFGFVPAAIMYHLIGPKELIAYIAFVIAVFSALRLANFNIDENQQTDFIGLPTPANALFISSLVFVKAQPELGQWLTPIVLGGISIVFSLLLISPIRLFSLKLKNLNWADNKVRIIFIIASAVTISMLGFIGLPLVILLYIILSLLENASIKSNSQ